MNMKLLNEKHYFCSGDKVNVYNRYNPSVIYRGMIYKIASFPLTRSSLFKREGCGPYVDYFYVSFEANVYAKLLMRGSEVIHNHNNQVIGNVILDNTKDNIVKLTIQYPLSTQEAEIRPSDINAILIWRDAYCIEAAD